MRSFSLLSVGLLGAFAALTSAQKVDKKDCHPPGGLHMILARGESAPGDGDPSVLNVLVKVRDDVLAGVPNSTVVGLGYDYKNLVKNAAVLSCAETFKNYIYDYVSSCGPNSNIAILGYSMGAMGMMDALCGTSSPGLIPTFPLNGDYYKYLIGAFTFGDETHNIFTPWAKGTCPDGIGLFPRYNNYACGPAQSALRTYCDQKDDQCCAGRGFNNNVGHFGYWDRYDADIVQFLNARLAAKKKATKA